MDDHGRFELAEELAGHHHHLACAACGTVEDVVPSARLERAMDEAARVVAEEQGYEVIGHQFDLVGTCPACPGGPMPRPPPPARVGRPPRRRAGVTDRTTPAPSPDRPDRQDAAMTRRAA